MTEPIYLSDEQRNHIEKVGRSLLIALDEIAQWADEQLNREQTMDGLNMIAQMSISASLAEVRQGTELLRREPAIARIVVQWQQPNWDSKTFLICRGLSAGAPTVEGLPVASYRAPIGQLAEYEPGEVATVWIGGEERTGKIIERQEWDPSHSDGRWDAKDCAYEVEGWQRFIASIRRFIEDVQRPTEDVQRPTTDSSLSPLDDIFASAEEEENVLHERYRRAIDRIALRDQPILDKHQGEVFRMPLNRRVMLTGPPGTGKTTTLIKRIAQKQTLLELPEDEVALVKSAGLEDHFSVQDGWAMFSPTELLTLYLRDAFNREGVPASVRQLKTWQRERQRLARNVIPILKTESGENSREDTKRQILRGRFREDTKRQILQSLKSPSISDLYDKFAEFHLEQLASRCRDAVSSIVTSEEKESQELSALLQGLRLENGSSLQILQRLCLSPVLRTVEKRIQEEIKNWTHREANRILQVKPAILKQLHKFLAKEEEDNKGNPQKADNNDAVSKRRAAELLISTLRTYATNAALGRSPRGRVKEILSDLKKKKLLPSPHTASKIGQRILLRSEFVVLINAPRHWVLNVAESYHQFRRGHPELYSDDIADRKDEISTLGPLFEQVAIADRKDLISGDEMDVLILLSLRNARTIQTRLGSSPPPSWLSRITQSYIPQVYIDEATDFSAVQLAVLMELSHPSLRSWFACGDFRQRITPTGIGSESELRWIEETCGIESPIELKRIEIPYRQSERLQEFSKAINPDLPTLQGRTQSAYQDDPPPLLLEGANQADASSWLARRIAEIERKLGELPSIAVFVNGDDKIGPTVSAAEESLQNNSIKIVGCPEGRIVGDTQEVRVFDVRHIKGLEFEAVFFIDLDDFAAVDPELFHRFFYVGATRAATYLGITCRNELPDRLTPVRALFSENGW